jgi:hypothetical protein
MPKGPLRLVLHKLVLQAPLPFHSLRLGFRPHHGPATYTHKQQVLGLVCPLHFELTIQPCESVSLVLFGFREENGQA